MTSIELTPVQEVVYHQIGNELLEERFDLGIDDKFTEQASPMPPAKVVWRSRHSAYCDVTGKKITKGQECVVIFAGPFVKKDTNGHKWLSRIALMVFVDEPTFFHLLELGSLTSLRTEKRLAAQAREAQSVVAPKLKPVYPEQNVCYCVQCGERIVRPEGMALVMFGKVYRCAKCQESGIAMAMTVQRFCRTCGRPFMPIERSQRLCTSCQSQLPGYEKHQLERKRIAEFCAQRDAIQSTPPNSLA